jgi:hypothetical protein
LAKSPKPVRPADRPNNGTFYVNKDNNLVYAQDILIENQQGGPPFTVAHAWACLRKCWKGLKIAKSKGEDQEAAKYHCAIQQLQVLLNLDTGGKSW